VTTKNTTCTFLLFLLFRQHECEVESHNVFCSCNCNYNANSEAPPPPFRCLFTAFNALTALVKEVSLKVVQNDGVVRSIHNHGIRELPHRFKAKHPDLRGVRYFEKGRFISVYYDSSPKTMRQVEGIFNLNDQVLRMTHLRARNKMDFVNVEQEKKNPYMMELKKKAYQSLWTDNEKQKAKNRGPEEDVWF
jgi:small subunit ribosomal protein S6